MRIGISGHQRLKDPTKWEWVRREIQDCLALIPKPIIGVTSLAIGADQLFAEIILQTGGSLEAIVPFHDYEKSFAEGRDRREYQRLLRSAAKVEVLQKSGSDEEAYFEAGKRVADLADLLIVIWDGKSAAGLGGTADIAEYAAQRRKSIVHINPLTRTVTR